MADKTIGTIDPAGTLILREVAAQIKFDDGREYDLTAWLPGLMPCVQSKQTGKFFHLSWPEIVEMAIAAGVDKEEEPT